MFLSSLLCDLLKQKSVRRFHPISFVVHFRLKNENRDLLVAPIAERLRGNSRARDKFLNGRFAGFQKAFDLFMETIIKRLCGSQRPVNPVNYPREKPR